MMSETKQIFHKAGGLNLLKQYWRAGVFWPAVVQFCLLGRSKKALEILRLTMVMKIQQKLLKKYVKVLDGYQYDKTLSHISRRIVWIFWWQGMDNAPDIVKRCSQSIKDNLGDWEIILITEANYCDFVSFPEHILKKFSTGVITLTHFSDLLRLELLIKYGGLWLDATVFCTSGDIPMSILNSDLFVYQAQKPGADGKASIMSSWCMFAKTNNRILMETRELLYEYWRKNNTLVDYFLLHQFFSIVCNRYPEEANKIPPFCNSIPHILLLHLFDEYDEQYWNDLKQMSCFHKLSYKLDEEKCKEKGTYYSRLFK